jgi:hypothetical protein
MHYILLFSPCVKIRMNTFNVNYLMYLNERSFTVRNNIMEIDDNI